MSTRITESVVEDGALTWFSGLGYSILYGPGIAPDESEDMPGTERDTYSDVVLKNRLISSLKIPNVKYQLITRNMIESTWVILVAKKLFLRSHQACSAPRLA